MNVSRSRLTLSAPISSTTVAARHLNVRTIRYLSPTMWALALLPHHLSNSMRFPRPLRLRWTSIPLHSRFINPIPSPYPVSSQGLIRTRDRRFRAEQVRLQTQGCRSHKLGLDLSRSHMGLGPASRHHGCLSRWKDGGPPHAK
jgi:hypothetical protein